MMTVLIVGGSRGIGLGLVERYGADGWSVHTTTRSGESPGAAVETHRLDVREPDQIADLARSVPVCDVVIHVAGVYQGRSRAEMFAVNVTGAIAVCQALIDGGRVVGKLAILTSQMGARRGRTESLGDYGDSKAALNDEFRRRAPGWGERGVTAAVIHPGWVRTEMGGSSAPLSVEESVDGIVSVMAKLTAQDHGRFLTWDGRDHPW